MSLQFKRNLNITPKPFCKVCKDAGLTEQEYTSHYVKSEPGPQGKVVCPTLLAQECRFCLGHGHTAKYCTVIEKNNNPFKSKQYEREKINYASEIDKKINPQDLRVLSKPEIKKDLLEDFPCLSPSSKKIVPINTIVGYASVAAKKPENFDNTKYERKLIMKSNQRRLPPIKNTTQRKSKQVSNEYLSDDSNGDEYEEILDDDEDELNFIHNKEIIKRKSLLDWSSTYDEEEKW